MHLPSIEPLISLFDSTNISAYIWDIQKNILSHVLIGMARTRGQLPALNKSFEQKLCEALTVALSEERDSTSQLLMARYLCDASTLEDIATAFVDATLNEDELFRLIQERAIDGSISIDNEVPLRRGLHTIVESLKDFVADDRYLIARALLERTDQICSTMHRVDEGIQSLQKSGFAFAPQSTQNNSQHLTFTSASPILSAVTGLSETFPSDAASSFVKDDFEKGLEELKTGSARKAREVFSTVVGRVEKLGINDHRNLYFRAKSNLGISTHLCGDDVEFAITCLEDAFQYSDGSLKGRTNKALAHSLRGDDATALAVLNGILAETPGHFDASAQKADCLGRLGRKEEAIIVLQTVRPENREQKTVLGLTFCALDDHENVALTASSILEESPDDPWAKFMLAQAIAVPLIERFNAEKVASGFRTDADRELLKEAISLLEGALVDIRKSDRPEMIAATLSNLCGYCCANGDIKKSLAYADEAMKVGKPHRALLQNRFLAAILGKEGEIALSAARALKDDFPEPQRAAMEIEALNALGRNQEALQILEEVKNAHQGALPSVHLEVLEVSLTLHLPDPEKADELCRLLTKRVPDDAFVWFTAANVAHDLGDPNEEEHLKTAISLAKQPGLKQEILGMLGVFYGRQTKWQEALECFLPDGVGPEYPTPYLIESATCYFNLGKHQQSLQLCTKKLAGGYDSAACVLAIQSCLAMFELEKAKALAERMAREDLRNESAALAYRAHLEFRMGQPEEARKLLLAAIRKGRNETQLLLLLSQVCLRLDRGNDALKYAFQALAVAKESELVEAHRAVISVGLSFPPDTKLEEADVQRIQLSVTYLASVANSGLTAIPDEPDFSTFRQMLRNQQDAAREGHRMFNDQGLPLYALSHMSGRDLYDTWKALTSGQGSRVKMAFGSREEQMAQREIASCCSGVVLEATSLLTFRMLGLLDFLPRIFNRVIVSYPTFEYFRDLITLSTYGPQSSGTIGLAGDRFHMQEVEPGSREREKIEFLTPIFDFLNSSLVERHGFDRPAQVNEVADFFETISNQGFASLIVAKTLGFPILCDDTGTLQVANLGFETNGFCSQAALRVAVERHIIKQDTYSDALIQLFGSNYHFVAEDLDSLISYLSRNGWELTPLIKSLFERFDKGEVDQAYSCKNMGSILAHAWMRTTSQSSNGDRWVSYICERLQSNGSEEFNIRYALVGVALVFIEVPDCFFMLVRAMRNIDGLPPHFRLHLDAAVESIVAVITKNTNGLLGLASERWATYAHRGILWPLLESIL